MGRKYAVTFSAVAVTAAQDLFDLAPASNKPVAIVSISLGQTTDSGDAQDEQLQITLVRGNSTVGSGGSSATAAPLSPADTASGVTGRVNDTTVATSGTAVTLHTDVWNVRAGYTFMFPPDARPTCTSTETRICLRQTAPADSVTMSGTIVFEELV